MLLYVYLIGNGSYIINQYPLEKTSILVGNKVFLLSNLTDYIMPNVLGWSSLEITSFCHLIGLQYKITGYGKVAQVNIQPGEKIDLNATLEIMLQN